MLDIIFAQIITPDMDTHDKLKACYDFLVVNIGDSRYEDVSAVPSPFAVISEKTDEELVAYCSSEHYSMTYVLAGEMLQWGDGVCDNFSAAFAVMAWKLGVPMYFVSGETADGAPHNWCQLDAPNGVTYVFDPHIEHLIMIRGSGIPGNSRFGAPREQIAGKYGTIVAIKDI